MNFSLAGIFRILSVVIVASASTVLVIEMREQAFFEGQLRPWQVDFSKVFPGDGQTIVLRHHDQGALVVSCGSNDAGLQGRICPWHPPKFSVGQKINIGGDDIQDNQATILNIPGVLIQETTYNDVTHGMHWAEVEWLYTVQHDNRSVFEVVEFQLHEVISDPTD